MVRVKCPRCGYVWDYRGNRPYTSCPKCRTTLSVRKNTVKDGGVSQDGENMRRETSIDGGNRVEKDVEGIGSASDHVENSDRKVRKKKGNLVERWFNDKVERKVGSILLSYLVMLCGEEGERCGENVRKKMSKLKKLFKKCFGGEFHCVGNVEEIIDIFLNMFSLYESENPYTPPDVETDVEKDDESSESVGDGKDGGDSK